MTPIWRTIKVFLSSTFLDLEEERDQLYRVFLQLDRTFHRHNLTLRPYDLRWRDRLLTQSPVAWCLQAVEECSYFIGIVGGRYGWRPPVGPNGGDNTSRLSITEMEIDRALAVQPRERRFFCFGPLPRDLSSQEDYRDIVRLRKKLIDHGETVYNYSHTEELSHLVYQNLQIVVAEHFVSTSPVPREHSTPDSPSTDLFLEQKCRSGLFDDLVRDFHRALSSSAVPLPAEIVVEKEPDLVITTSHLDLVRQIVDLEINFLRRHPESLFSMLWNYGHHHDGPHIDLHWENIPTSSNLRPFWKLIEYWRRKRTSQDRLPWAQALRPQPNRLDSPLKQALVGHGQSVYVAQYSPDGESIASGSRDGQVILWSRSQGEIQEILDGHTDRVMALAYHPHQTELATAGYDGTIRIWPLQGVKEPRVLTGHQDWIWSVAYHPEGQYLASSSRDESIRIWRGDETVAVLTGHRDEIYGVAFTHDGRQLVSTSRDGTVRLWDWADRKETHRWSVEGWASAVTVSRENKIAASLRDGSVLVGDGNTGDIVAHWTGHQSRICSIAFSPGGDEIITGGYDRIVAVWNWKEEVCCHTLRGHSGAVYSVDVHPYTGEILSGSYDRTICRWHREEETRDIRLIGPSRWIKALALSPDETEFASAGEEGTIYRWDGKTGTLKGTLVGHEKAVGSLAYSPQGNWLVSGGYDGKVVVWNLARERQILTWEGLESWIGALQFSPDGTWLAVGEGSGEVHLWPQEGDGETLVWSDHDGPVYDLAFSPSGEKLATGSQDGTVQIRSTTTGDLLREYRGHERPVSYVSFVGENQIASGDSGYNLHRWQIDTEETVERRRTGGDLTSLVSPSAFFEGWTEEGATYLAPKGGEPAPIPGLLAGLKVTSLGVAAGYRGDGLYIYRWTEETKRP